MSMPSYSPALQSVYNGDTTGLAPFQAVVLSHSAWAEPLALTPHLDAFDGVVDGIAYTFEPAVMSVVVPGKDQNGNQQMSLTFNAVDTETISLLKQALAQPQEYIRVVYTEYLEGDTAAQIDPPYRLYVAQVTLSGSTLTATASRPDLINRAFPGRVFRADEFPGLLR